MRIIARIPDVSAPGVQPASAGLRAPRPKAPERGGAAAGTWPAWQIGALAAIAAVTWMLALRNDPTWSERGGDRVRTAREPATSVTAPTSSGGAVVR